MTISAHHVDSVINAYNKQSKLKSARTAPSEEEKEAIGEDSVVPQKGTAKAEAYKKISYSIIDVILKKKKL